MEGVLDLPQINLLNIYKTESIQGDSPIQRQGNFEGFHKVGHEYRKPQSDGTLGNWDSQGQCHWYQKYIF